MVVLGPDRNMLLSNVFGGCISVYRISKVIKDDFRRQ
jgi:hypothetical protein